MGYCMVISALCVEMSLVMKLFFIHGPKDILLESLMEGLFCAGAVMITYGAVPAPRRPRATWPTSSSSSRRG